MPDRNTTLPIVAILVALLFVVSPGDPLPTQQPQAKEASRRAAKDVEQTAIEPDERLLAPYLGLIPAGEAPSGAKLLGIRRDLDFFLSRAQGSLRVVVASLPDPIDSHLAFIFDQHVDALQRSAADLGYSLHSFYFPWPGDRDENASARKHRSEPGALLFRKGATPEQPENDHLLLLLLVGETPTSGVHPVALSNAMRRSFVLQPDMREIAFIGPTFSGSATTLRRQILKSVDVRSSLRGRLLQFYSGSATAKSVADALTIQGRQPGNRVRISATFERVTHDDPTRMAALREYLELRGESAVVALLVEGGTAYGAAAAAAAKSADTDAAKESGELLIRFPLHISQLRSSAEVEGKARQKTSGLDTPFRRAALELELHDDVVAIDVPSPFSPGLSANVAELELASSLTALRRRHVQHAGIIATDKRDELLLAQILRRVAPEVHVFSLESDVLYAHPRFSQDLLGTIIVSSYPLLGGLSPRLQSWTGAESWRKVVSQSFGSGGVDGSYRAALLAYSGNDPCGAGQPNRDVLPCAWLSESQRPPVWISAIGRDGAWPIWTSGAHASLAAADPNDPEVPAARPAVFYRVALVVLALLSGFFAVLYAWSADVLPRRLAEPTLSIGSRLHSELGTFSWLFSGRSRLRRASSALFLLTLAGLLAWASGLALIPAAAEPRAAIASALCTLPDLWLAGAVLWLLLIPAILHAALCATLGNVRSSRAIAFGVAATSSATLAAGIAALFASVRADSPANWVLFSFRTTHLESGLSPVSPIALLCGGILLMAMVLARRAQLYERARLLVVKAQRDDAGLAEKLTEELAPWSTLQRLGPLGFGSYALLWMLPSIAFAGTAWFPIDSWICTWTFVAATIVLLFGLVHSGVGFLTVWARMRRLLRALAVSPLRDAFGRLPSRLGRTVGLEPQAAPSELSELRYSLQLARLLGETEAGARAGAAQTIDPQTLREIEVAFEGELAAANVTARRTPAVLSATQEMLTQLAGALEAALASDTGIASAPAAGANPGPREVWQQRAQEFVAAQVVAYLSYVFIHLRTSLRGTTIGLLLLLLALSAYPFEPQVPALNFAVVLIGLAVAAALATFTQASRNELLSLIEGTTPNKVTWNANLFGQLASYVALPLLAALAAQLPALGRTLSTVFSAFTTR